MNNKIIITLLMMSLSQLAFGQTPPAELEGTALQTWLKQNWYDGKHNQLTYTVARRHMYNTIDNYNNTLTGVYSGYELAWTAGGTSNAVQPLNCEHTVPQSFFDSDLPMRSDIHHLFPTYDSWNSERGSNGFLDITDSQTTKWMRGSSSQGNTPSSFIDEYSESNGNKFEPREDHKGNVARAVMYFYTMYPTTTPGIDALFDLETLHAWNEEDPVNTQEQERNDRTEVCQGNRNPYIDYPDLAIRAFPLSAAQVQNVMLTASMVDFTLTWDDIAGESGYYIYRGESIFAQTTLVATLDPNVTTYVDNMVNEGTTYYYRVVSFNAGGEGNPSSLVSGTLEGVAVNIFEQYLETVELFPNPSSGRVWLSINNLKAHETVFRVYDILGQSIIEEQVYLTEGENRIRIDIESRGLYLLRINGKTLKVMVGE